jgi:Mg-chelatase subunit ChlD
MPFLVPKNPQAAKIAALAAARAAAQDTAKPDALTRWINPGEAKDRIRIVFDDSGSMYKEAENAKEGTVEFLRNCIPNQTSVAVHFLKTENERLSTLNSNLMEIASLLKDARLALGGTPLFAALSRALALAPKATRYVVFTDGEPTDSLAEYMEPPPEEKQVALWEWKRSADILIEMPERSGAPIDTVFFGPSEIYTADQRDLLHYIAEKTGGYYLHFDPAKVNFRTAFKYLAPTQRLALASESVRREIESGKRT